MNSMIDKSSKFFVLVNLQKANKNIYKPKDPLFTYDDHFNELLL
jgi:hypothetical protein